MELPELIRRAPWAAARVPDSYYVDVFTAFLRAFRLSRVQTLIAPSPGRAPSRLARHPWPELFLQFTGTTWFSTPGGDLEGAAGTLVLMPRGTPHAERWSDLGAGHALVVAMPRDGRLAVQTAVMRAGGARRPCHARVFADQGGTDAGRLCDELAGLARQPPADAETLRPLVEALLGRLGRCASAAPGEPTHDPLVDRCLHLLATHLHNRELGVATLANDLGVGADHLGRTFRRTTGETLLAHIARRRMQVARELLADPARSIAEVAGLCGFADPAYFSRTFRRVAGCDPRSYRKAADPG